MLDFKKRLKENNEQLKARLNQGSVVSAGSLGQPKVKGRKQWKDMGTGERVGVVIVLVVFAFIVIGVVSAIAGGSKTQNTTKQQAKAAAPASQPKVSTPAPQPKKTTPAPQPKPAAPKQDTSDLNATVKLSYDVPGVEITNNENVNWDSCKFDLNDQWSRQITNPLEPNSPLNNPYGLFVKSDGTRFDIDTTQPKNVFISCKVSGNTRTNYYVFN